MRNKDHLAQQASPPLRAAVDTCRGGLVAVALFSALMNVLMLTGPFFMLQVYDRVLTSRSVPTLLALALIAVLLYLFFGLFDWLRARLLGRVSQAFDHQLAETAFRVSAGNTAPGLSPLQDLRSVQQFLSGPALATLFDMPWFPVYLAVIFLLHPFLGVLALCGALVLVVIAVMNRYFAGAATDRTAAMIGREDRLAMAGRRQAETLNAMGMLGDTGRLWRGHHNERLGLQQSSTDRQAIFASGSKTLRLVLQSAILGSGAYLVIGNELSAGALIAASIIFGRALAPLDQTIAQWRSIADARAAYGRLKTAVMTDVRKRASSTLNLPERRLRVSDLFVAAPDDGDVLLEGVSLELAAGDALGIIGPSGSGKSTLLKGILGLWPLRRGEVRFDGATLDQWPVDNHGLIIGYLPQDIELYPGTIAENISRFRSAPSADSLLEAGHLAGVHDLIVSKPQGFDTIVGPGGTALSGGERQRIALARAVYDRPFLVVLDEPNSNLDGVGERALSDTIKSLREQGSIVIVVTHRNAALSQVNKLLQIEAGRPVAFGDTERVLQHIREQQKASAERRLRVVE